MLVKKNSEPSSIKIFFSHEKESKKLFSYHVEQKYVFHKTNTLTTHIRQRNIFVSSQWQHNFFFSYDAKSNFFSGQLHCRALNFFSQKKIPSPLLPPTDKKMVVAFKETEKWGEGDNLLVNKSWTNSPQHLPFYVTQGGRGGWIFFEKN